MHLRTRDESLSVGPNEAALNLRVVIEGGAKWTPYLRAVELDGATRDVPEDFRKGGAQSLACVGATDEEASDNLCRAFLEVGVKGRSESGRRGSQGTFRRFAGTILGTPFNPVEERR